MEEILKGEAPKPTGSTVELPAQIGITSIPPTTTQGFLSDGGGGGCRSALLVTSSSGQVNINNPSSPSTSSYVETHQGPRQSDPVKTTVDDNDWQVDQSQSSFYAFFCLIYFVDDILNSHTSTKSASG